ncbi:hypothetical protein CCACVL1_13331 [Corchorus capsularis]|uniref:Uncharacterized protein n=1 Tax=Corchorus capsularis TaxID=210143 RepID=A0A1R3IBF9_COCAP|nr:hypothetical protein CCACVL1_13331 [Corchorus capsularis]
MGPSINSDAANGGGIKKIRLLVTKQELRQLLSKAMSMEEILVEGVQREGGFRVDFVQRWQPLLETIPEGF